MLSALRLGQIDRYMLRQLLAALLASTGGLVALIWLTQSLRFIDLVVNRGLSMLVFLQLTGLLIPGFIAVILPITTYVVVQFVYMRFAGDREITVMRSAGLSPFALARPALILAALAALSCLFLDVWIVPHASAAFREEQFRIRNRMAAFLLQDGVFSPVSEDLTVYVRKRDTDGTLRGVLIDDRRQKNAHATILARRGRFLPAKDAPRLLLLEGTRQEIDQKTGRLNILTFAENVVELTSTSKGNAQRFRDATEMSLGELLHPDPAIVSPRDVPKFEVEAHRRLSSPFTAVSFALVALVAVLRGAFQRHGGLLRPFVAVLVVVGLLALGLVVANLASRFAILIPLIWVVAVLPGMIAAAVLFVPELRRGAHPRAIVERLA
uniref:LPS export ABC transporter permease LptF n=1 Tax=Acidicaldus sp. TaxID=1872105 RepID=A0A8J4HD33_9PROT